MLTNFREWGRLAAISLAILLLGGIGAIWWSYFKGQSEGNHSVELEIASSQQILGTRTTLERSLEALDNGAVVGGLLRGSTEGQISASLVSYVTQLIESAGGDVLSSQIQPARQEAEILHLRARFEANLNVAALSDLLLSLEFSNPLILVEEIRIDRAVRVRRQSRTAVQSDLEQLRVTFEITGFALTERNPVQTGVAR